MSQNKLAILCDSLAYLPKDYQQAHDIFVVPLSVTFSDGSYRDMIEMTTEDFFEKIKTTDEYPKSSQPSMGTFLDTFADIQNKGYKDVLAIMVTPRASGTYETLQMAAKSQDTLNVIAFNSGTGLQAQGYMIEEAVKRRMLGQNIEEIEHALQKLKQYTKLYVILDDIQFVLKGGRLGAAASTIVNFLKIKPIVGVGNDHITISARTRSIKKATQKIIQLLETDIKKGYPLRMTLSGDASFQPYQEFKTQLLTDFPHVKFEEGVIGPTISVHSGPRAFGLMWTLDTDQIDLDTLA